MAVDVAAGVLAGLALLAALLAVAFVVRRRALQRAGGAVDCSLRFPVDSAWMLGVARYHGDALQWYRAMSLSTRPRHLLSRQHLVVIDRRAPDPAEADVLLADAVVVSCRQDGDAVELAFSEQALTGFLAWMEASPPGTHTQWS